MFCQNCGKEIAEMPCQYCGFAGTKQSTSQPETTTGKTKHCKSCGEKIAKSASICPKCGAKQKKRHPILGVLIAIFGIGIIASALNGGGKSPQKVGDVKNSAETVVPVSTQAQTEFHVGDIVSLNGVEVTFTSCAESSGKQFLNPESGNVFLICEFNIDNKSQKDIAVSSIASFEAYADDYSVSVSLTGIASTDKQQLGGTVATGKKMSGAIVYEVPKDWKILEIRFTPDFWAGEDITFIARH